MKRPASSNNVGSLHKSAKTLLKRPAASGSHAPVKCPAAAVLQDIVLPALAPVHHPSKRPKREGRILQVKDPPRSHSKVVNNASFDQSSLRSLASQTPQIQKLHLSGCGVSKPPVLDLTAVGIRFPELTHLEVENWPLASGRFDVTVFPKLKSLHIRYPFDGEMDTADDWDEFKACLPDLRELILECPGTVQASQIKATTQACPKLIYLCLYKVYVENLSLVLPSAKHLWLHRLECLKSASIYAPCVKEVCLQACYDLRHVKMLHRTQGIPGAVEESRFVLDVTNCCFDMAEIEKLREIPRVKYLVLPSDDCSLSEDEQQLDPSDGSVFKLGHFMKPPGMTAIQLDGMCGMRSYGDEAGVCVYEKVQVASKIEVKQMARVLEWGAQAIYVWYNTEVSQEARVLAKQAKIPLRFWEDVTCKAGGAKGKMPILTWCDDMKRQIETACG